MTLTQRSIDGMLHDQERRAVLYTKVQHRHDILVLQVDDEAGLITEPLYIFAGYLCLEHFDSRKGTEVDMLSLIDIGKPPCPIKPIRR